MNNKLIENIIDELLLPYVIKEVNSRYPTLNQGAKQMIKDILLSEVVSPKNVTLSDYPQELIDSIKKHGIVVPIVVTDKYQILDGRGRYLIAVSLDMKTIPCYVISASDPEDLEYKIIPSKHHIPVDPIIYAKALKTILKVSNMTIEDLAEEIDKSPEWIKNKLTILEDES